MDQLRSDYQKIENSKDKVLKGMLKHLQKSEHTHWVSEMWYKDDRSSGKSTTVNAGPNPNGTGDDTNTEYNYEKSKHKFGTTVHEMQHQYDYDISNAFDDNGKGADNPMEIRAVKTQNRAREIDGLAPKTSYDGKEIDPKKLANIGL